MRMPILRCAHVAAVWSRDWYGAKFFSKLNLRIGYRQVEIEEKDRHKIAFFQYEILGFMSAIEWVLGYQRLPQLSSGW